MENREAIMTLQAHVVFACEKAGLSKAAVKEVEDALDTVISALEKQEQDNNKSCDTCKHKNLPVSKFPCDECYFASDFEDHYEPYTEEEL